MISASSIFFGSSHMWWKTASTYALRPPSSSAAAAPRMICTVLTGKCWFTLNCVSPCLAMKRLVSSR